MAKEAIDDLAIILSASTDRLAGDLRAAARMVEAYAKTVSKDIPMGAGKAPGLDVAGIRKAAAASGAMAAREFGKSWKGVKEAASLPFRAMAAGGGTAALADPFLLATAAVDTLAAVVEVPFKLAAAAAHMAAPLVALPFQLAGVAVEGLTAIVGGVTPLVGGAIAGLGKLAGGSLHALGAAASGIVSGIGSVVGALGNTFSAVFGGVAKAAIQGLVLALGPLRESVNLAADLEQTKIAFDVLTGSATKATAVLAGLRQFAAETPFSQLEVTSTAKSLAGYGIAAEQLVPTIRTLGDVSAATGKPLAEMAYLYGTLINQDRAYIVDIKQFATAGIPIYEELARVLGVTTDRTREMVEAGRVGIPEVQKAFKNMTSEGGRFHGLMAKQAESFGGLREQLADAFQIGKTHLGQVLIEELGLKDAARDLTTFTKSIESQIDRVRPVVRFLGELGRGVANVGYEFGKAAANIGALNLDGFARAFPELGNTLQSFKDFMAGLKDFKLDPEEVANFGFRLAESAITGLAGISDWVESNGREYYQSFKDNFVKPIEEMISTIKTAVDWLESLSASVNRRADKFGSGLDAIQGNQASKEFSREINWFTGGGWKLREHRESIMRDANSVRAGAMFAPLVGEAVKHPERFGPRQEGESADDYTNRYRALAAHIDMAAHLQSRGFQGAAGQVEELLKQRMNFLSPYTNDTSGDFQKIHESLMSGKVPALKSGLGEPAAPSRKETALDRLAAFKNDVLGGLRAQKAADAESRAIAATAMGLKTAFGVLAGSSDFAAASLEKMGRAEEEFKVKWAPDPFIMETAKKAREAHGVAPEDEIAREFDALKKSAALGALNQPGGIDLGTYHRAVGALYGRAEQAVGPARLPDAAMKDTTESVRILNQWRSGNRGPGTAEQLLAQILEVLKSNKEATANLPDALGTLLPIVLPLGQ